MNQTKANCTLSDLRKLEVINVCNGKRLGYVVDIEFDLCNGNVNAIIVPKKAEISDLFCKRNQRYIRIPWCNIERIGDDIILIRCERRE